MICAIHYSRFEFGNAARQSRQIPEVNAAYLAGLNPQQRRAVVHPRQIPSKSFTSANGFEPSTPIDPRITRTSRVPHRGHGTRRRYADRMLLDEAVITHRRAVDRVDLGIALVPEGRQLSPI